MQTIGEEKQIIDIKTDQKQHKKGIKINYEKIPKRNKFFELIVKKPNELIDWYKRTPPKRRRNYYYSYLIKYGLYSAGYLSLCILLYQWLNSEENPITGRNCIYSLPKELVDELEEDIFNDWFVKYSKSGSFIPATNNYVKRLDRCVEKLIKDNFDIEGIGEKTWTPVVIDDDNKCDAIVFKESGHIFVFKKMLDLCESDHQLAYVLAHQLAHMLLDHRREPVTYTSIWNYPFVTIMPKLWIIGRPEDLAPKFDWMQSIDNWFNNLFKKWIRDILQFSPYTQQLEEEADRIALQLITRSCYDVRESRNFCKKYKHLSQLIDSDMKNGDNDHYFAKHPINNNTINYLNSYINPFIELRKECNCEPLV